MRLTRIESAEVAASPAKAPEPTAKSTAPAPESTTKSAAPTAAPPKSPPDPLRQRAIRTGRLDRVANPVHIHTRKRAHLSCLPAKRNGVSAKVRIRGHRRQRRSCRAACTRLVLCFAAHRVHQAQRLRAIGRELSNGLGSSGRRPTCSALLTVLLRLLCGSA